MVGARRFFASKSGVSAYVADKRLGATALHTNAAVYDNEFLQTLVQRHRALIN
jgi:hypothetical protein